MSWQRSNIGSRVTREGHARFWERPEVKFLRATRQAETRLTVQPRSAFESIADPWAPVRWDYGLFLPLRAAGLNRAIPCSDCPQQRHKIIRNGVALVGKESVSGVTGGSGPRYKSGEPTRARVRHRQ